MPIFFRIADRKFDNRAIPPSVPIETSDHIDPSFSRKYIMYVVPSYTVQTLTVIPLIMDALSPPFQVGLVSSKDTVTLKNAPLSDMVASLLIDAISPFTDPYSV